MAGVDDQQQASLQGWKAGGEGNGVKGRLGDEVGDQQQAGLQGWKGAVERGEGEVELAITSGPACWGPSPPGRREKRQACQLVPSRRVKKLVTSSRPACRGEAEGGDEGRWRKKGS